MRVRTRTDVLNHLIKRNGYSRYLEIGVRRPEQNFDRVRAATKESVDPAPLGPATHEMTSDEFFASRRSHADPFDIVLIDGLHIEGQVLRDVENALRLLSTGGSVVLHDCNPMSEAAQREAYDGESTWNGTVWKAWAKLRMSRSDLSMLCIDIDHGVGVIARGTQQTFPPTPEAELDYDFLAEHRKGLLNLIAPADFASAVEATFPHARESRIRRVLRG